MKLEDLKKTVAEMVEEGMTDKNKIASNLIANGATLSMVHRELPKLLVEHGVVEKRESILAQVKAHLEGKTLTIPETADEFSEQCAEYAEQMEVEQDNKFEKAVRAVYKENGIDIPSKPNLGKMKTLLIDYFRGTDKRSLKGLAEYMEGQGVDEEKALHFARMNYTFAETLWTSAQE